jgi:hypothetical protein
MRMHVRQWDVSTLVQPTLSQCTHHVTRIPARHTGVARGAQPPNSEKQRGTDASSSGAGAEDEQPIQAKVRKNWASALIRPAFGPGPAADPLWDVSLSAAPDGYAHRQRFRHLNVRGVGNGVCVCVCVRARVSRVDTRSCALLLPRSRLPVHACARARSPSPLSRAPTHAHTHRHTHTHTRTDTHTHTDTHTCTYMHSRVNT